MHNIKKKREENEVIIKNMIQEIAIPEYIKNKFKVVSGDSVTYTKEQFKYIMKYALKYLELEIDGINEILYRSYSQGPNNIEVRLKSESWAISVYKHPQWEFETHMMIEDHEEEIQRLIERPCLKIYEKVLKGYSEPLGPENICYPEYEWEIREEKVLDSDEEVRLFGKSWPYE